VVAVSEFVAGPATQALVTKLEALGGVLREDKGMVSVTLPKASIVEAVEQAKNGGFPLIADVFGIDYLTYPGHQGRRFTVAYNLRNLEGTERVFLRVDIDEGRAYRALPTCSRPRCSWSVRSTTCSA